MSPLREFDRSLPMALLRAREAVMARFRPLFRLHGVTEQQWRVLRALRDYLEQSRRAAYHASQWLPGLPASSEGLDRERYQKMLAQNLAWQMNRQKSPTSDLTAADVTALAARVTDLALAEVLRREGLSGTAAQTVSATELIGHMLGHMEFLARPERRREGSTGRPAAAE